MPVIRTIRCKGGIRLEIPPEGSQWFAEKLYPEYMDQKIRTAEVGYPTKLLYSYFARESFRMLPRVLPGTTAPHHKQLIACPKHKWGAGKCRTSTVVIHMYHPYEELGQYLHMCETGELARKRKSAIRRIHAIIDEIDKRYAKVAGLAEFGDFGFDEIC